MTVDVLETGTGPRSRHWLVVGLVGALAAVGWLSLAAPPAEPVTTTPSTNPVRLAPVPVSTAAPELGDALLHVDFAEVDSGYTLAAACHDGQCGYRLFATQDGGTTWSARRLPLAVVTLSEGYSAELTVLSATSVLIVDRGRRWFTADAGRTWQNTPQWSGRKVGAVPTGARIVGACSYEYEKCHEPLASLDPATGRLSPLASQPRIDAAFVHDRAVSAADGSLWIASTQGGVPVVAVTSDRGRTWRTSPLAKPTTPYFGTSIVTRDGRTAYAFVRAQAPTGVPVKNGLAAIWRTTDGGTRWQRVPGAHPSSLLGAALLPDGRLLITTEELGRVNLRYSTDGGRHFRPSTTSQPILGWVTATAGRFTAGGAYGGYYTSTDGIRWTELTPSSRPG